MKKIIYIGKYIPFIGNFRLLYLDKQGYLCTMKRTAFALILLAYVRRYCLRCRRKAIYCRLLILYPSTKHKLQYSPTTKLDFGFNIDAIGFSFGKKQEGIYTSSIYPAGKVTAQSGKPAG